MRQVTKEQPAQARRRKRARFAAPAVPAASRAGAGEASCGVAPQGAQGAGEAFWGTSESTLTPKIPASLSRFSVLGALVPASHLATACRLTPTSSATCS